MYERIVNYFSGLELAVLDLSEKAGDYAVGLYDLACKNIPITAVIGLIALWLAGKNYWRKSGVHVTGGFAVTSDYTSTQKYVSELILENQKDRAVTIYAIYLRIGFNYYVELEDLGESPIILKSYESLKRKYDKPYLYATSSTVVTINRALNDKRFKKRIVLSTGSGRYVIPSPIKRWNPIVESFSNSSVLAIFPQNLPYRGLLLGDNVIFVLDINHKDRSFSFPITKYDSSMTSIFGVRFTLDDLTDKNTLAAAIADRKNNGEIPTDAFIDVKEVPEIIGASLKFYGERKTVELPYINFATYYIYGRVIAKIKSLQVKRQNNKRRLG